MPNLRLPILGSSLEDVGLDLHNLKGTVWSVEDFQMFDIGSGDMALEESARASVAQADRLP